MTCNSSNWSITSATKADCISGSPPENVTPPSAILRSLACWLSRVASSLEVKVYPTSLSPADPFITCGNGDKPSGLWHHEQRSPQPFIKTVVLIPGPS